MLNRTTEPNRREVMRMLPPFGQREGEQEQGKEKARAELAHCLAGKIDSFMELNGCRDELKAINASRPCLEELINYASANILEGLLTGDVRQSRRNARGLLQIGFALGKGFDFPDCEPPVES